MEAVEFKFNNGQRVETQLGEEGIVDGQLNEVQGRKYYVKTRQQSTWHDEDSLLPWPEHNSTDSETPDPNPPGEED